MSESDPREHEDSAQTEAHTEAVPFDPFADDDDEFDTEATTGPLTVDSGEKSRREALSTFRQRRGIHRRGATVAGGT